jgi:hypothetical protein
MAIGAQVNLAVGSSSLMQQQEKDSLIGPPSMVPIREDGEEDDGHTLTELRSLKDLLGKALAAPVNTPQKLLQADLRHVYSSCSVSTMVEDDVASNGEINSTEESGIEFELDIEAGAAAALSASMTPQVPTVHVDKDHVNADAVPLPLNLLSPSFRCHGKTTPEMSHRKMPRPRDMKKMYESCKDEPPTTMMIRNIPGRYEQTDFMMDLEDLGFAGTYDFLYMPVDKATAINVGYAFVNFTDHYAATKFLESFKDYRFKRHRRKSKRLAAVSVAHMQGLENNLQYYKNTLVNTSKVKGRRPVVMPNIAKIVSD